MGNFSLGGALADALKTGAGAIKDAVSKSPQQKEKILQMPARDPAAPAAQAQPAPAVQPLPAGTATPVGHGVIGPDQSKWPPAFVDPRGATFLTAKFDGFEEPSGLARVHLSNVAAPASAVDVGMRHSTPDQRKALAAELLEAQKNGPIMLKGGGSGFVPFTVESFNAQAIHVKQAGQGVVAADSSHLKTIMDPNVLSQTLKSVTTQIETLHLDRVPPPRPGQAGPAWVDDAMNSSLVQAMHQLKARGVPYEMGAKGSLDGAQAFDCSGFVSAMMHRAGQNLNDSSGKPLMKNVGGTAADMVAQARANGGAITTAQLLAHPEPGTIIGLSTGEPWAKGRPLGIDHIAVVMRDSDGIVKVAEYTPNKSGGSGLRVTPLEPWVQHYASKGDGVYAAAPAGLCDQAVLAKMGAAAPVVMHAAPDVAAQASNDPRM